MNHTGSIKYPENSAFYDGKGEGDGAGELRALTVVNHTTEIALINSITVNGYTFRGSNHYFLPPFSAGVNT